MYSIMALIIYLYFYIERMSFMEKNNQLAEDCTYRRTKK